METQHIVVQLLLCIISSAFNEQNRSKQRYNSFLFFPFLSHCERISRMSQVDSIKLSDEFIASAMSHIKPHWGPLGWVTYKRTYARYLDDQHRTEEWHETVKRVVEGNINLDPRLHPADGSQPDPTIISELTTEAENLFVLIYGLSATPSGRNLWVSGTPYQNAHGDSLNNCWFVAIRPQKYGDSAIVPDYLSKDQLSVSMPYAFMFDELMKGGGVGFSVTQENVSQLPTIDRAADVTVLISNRNGSAEESRTAGALSLEEWTAQHGDPSQQENTYFYKLEDSREGWVRALAATIDAHFSYFPSDQTHIILDMSDIRPRGERIHGFGGTASGAAPLVEMLLDVNTVLNTKVSDHLSSVDATDISNMIGKAVVAGNVRRSAELALGNWNDSNFRVMKQDQEQLAHHRWASNNSVVVNGQRAQYEEVAKAVVVNGEPGIVDLDLSRHYGRLADGFNENADPYAEGTNPCGEITLENGEPCNLFEVFPYIAEQQGWDLKEVFRLATRYTKRVTFGTYDWEISRTVIQRNRRLGVSMSGIQDWFLGHFGKRVVTGYHEEIFDDGSIRRIPEFDPEITEAVDQLYQAVIDADREYSTATGTVMSIKHTTVKPSGTVAKLAGSSEGMHFQWAEHFIQRIRFQSNDPLLPTLQACGYYSEPDVYTSHTMCVEFPVESSHWNSPEFASAGSVSAEEQLANQSFLQQYWSDNAVSCTVTFQENEKKDLPEILANYAGMIKSTSLLGYVDGGYAQMPKETISNQTYMKKVALITGDPETEFKKINSNLDEDNLTLVDSSDCASGACPVR